MAIEVIAPREALNRTARSLNVSVEPYSLAAQVLRRAIYVDAPCPAHRVIRSVVSALSPLSDGPEWEEIVEDCLDDLIHYGDVFESRILDADTGRAAFQLRPAPPAFVKRSDGTIIVLGVAGDEITPQIAEWSDALRCRGALRFIEGRHDAATALAAAGVSELHESLWLRSPPAASPREFVAAWSGRLNQQAPSSAIVGLELLNGKGRGRGRRQRWVAPGPKDSGLFVARRGQLYGASRWCAVTVAAGVPNRLIDIAADGDVERPCDIGWRLQAALDHEAGNPQKARCAHRDSTIHIEFFNPLPSWAERHLAVVGEKAFTEHCLFAFDVPSQDWEREKRFLGEMLWMTFEDGGAAT